MLWFLSLGFLTGLSHALEADHLAAIGAMAVDKRKKGRGEHSLARRGAAWGIGHALTLFAICAAAILLGLTLSDQLAAALEFAVGLMLIFLGVDVIRRMRRARIHFHKHDHGDGAPHIHAHSHAKTSDHNHEHARGLPLKPLLVGLAHGAAGSGALLVLALAATQEPWLAIVYVVIFGVGAVAGMALLTYAASWPLSWAERGAGWIYKGVSLASAAVAMGLGVSIVVDRWAMAIEVF
ncbi:MAG: hypothetical protein ACPGGK_03820 [Pikeienuella sp.]